MRVIRNKSFGPIGYTCSRYKTAKLRVGVASSIPPHDMVGSLTFNRLNRAFATNSDLFGVRLRTGNRMQMLLPFFVSASYRSGTRATIRFQTLVVAIDPF